MDANRHRQQPAIPEPHCAARVGAATSIYGATKLAQEHILSAWCGAFGAPLSILRLQNVYGEGQSPHNSYTGIINVFHRLARAGNSIPIYEDGEIGRDFIHIDDVDDIFAHALADESGANYKFDVGSGQLTTIRSAAQTIAGLYAAPEPHVCGKFRDGDIRSAVADIGDMVSYCGNRAKISFDAGARRTGIWLGRSAN